MTNRAGRARGFTLVELMIALTIGLFLVGAMLTTLMTSAALGRTNERASDVNINGNYALSIVKRDVQHAGHLGLTSVFSPDAPLDAKFTVANVCDAAKIGQISQRIWGDNDNNPYSGTCLKSTDYSQGDVLVVRRLSTSPAAKIADNVVYYRSSYEGGDYFTSTSLPTALRQPPLLDYRLEETVYYVSPYTTSAGESPRVPALYRLKLADGPKMQPELVASGVENLQVRYGIIDSAGNYQYLDAQNVGARWDLVTAVDISLLVRAGAKEPGYTASATYKIGDRTITASDGYRRVVFSTVVDLRN
ncbi:MAG TPA: PilW family protein [Burkholderiales bacterium]|nr:PilW family protein [Burkholderiales bacterium]